MSVIDHVNPRIKSEDLEPHYNSVMGTLFQRCRDSEDTPQHENECMALWVSSGCFARLATACNAVAMQMKAQDDRVHVADYISKMLGIDPYEEWLKWLK